MDHAFSSLTFCVAVKKHFTLTTEKFTLDQTYRLQLFQHNYKLHTDADG